MEREATMADFDSARAEWEEALAGVPDGALTYLKPGDDYALGGLQVHVTWVLVHYTRTLGALISGGFTPFGPLDSPGEAEGMNRKAKVGLTPAERDAAVEEMAVLHATVVGAVNGLSDEDWTRKAPVVYGAGDEPYPTSPEDVVGWLRDHYREHVQHSADLAHEWALQRLPGITP